MTGKGSPDLWVEGGEGLRVAVVAAQWHEEVMAGLLGGALRALEAAGVRSPAVVRVPGAFELPVAARRLADAGADAVVALGVVIRGGTPHFEYVCLAATSGLTQIAAATGVPVGFGVLTCDTEDQARDRAGLPGSAENKGREAAQAAIATALALGCTAPLVASTRAARLSAGTTSPPTGRKRRPRAGGSASGSPGTSRAPDCAPTRATAPS